MFSAILLAVLAQFPVVTYSAPAVYAAPAVSYALPTVSYGVPAVSYAAPMVSYATPAVSYAVPAVSYAAPVVSYAAPLYGATVYSVAPTFATIPLHAGGRTVIKHRGFGHYNRTVINGW